MSEKKIIAVVGATGAQGGGLVRAIQRDPKSLFRARAITRNPASDAAKALAALGAEVVKADVDDAASMKRAFTGAHGAFCVTFFWAHFSPEKELAEATLMAQTAKETGVAHAVWSTLEDTRKWVPLSDDRMPTLMGKYKVPHFDAKGEANVQFTSRGVPTTLYHTSFFWDNFIFFGAGPKPGPDGQLLLTLPMGDRPLPAIAAEDVGKCAYGVFKRGSEFIGKNIAVSGEILTGTELAAKMSRAIGKPIRYNPVPPSVYRSFGFPGADDLGNMFQFKHDFNADFCKPRDPAFARSLNPDLQTFDQWLAQNAKKIPLE
ncbi:MAG TPA: NmrA/HSCARG family protein [Gemmatimonadales bacterium]|nr:NmrA/HSCARG family protein [Gemmatimonadales bacterium]